MDKTWTKPVLSGRFKPWFYPWFYPRWTKPAIPGYAPPLRYAPPSPMCSMHNYMSGLGSSTFFVLGQVQVLFEMYLAKYKYNFDQVQVQSIKYQVLFGQVQTKYQVLFT